MQIERSSSKYYKGHRMKNNKKEDILLLSPLTYWGELFDKIAFYAIFEA